jgi:HAMP domain-containing protein
MGDNRTMNTEPARPEPESSPARPDTPVPPTSRRQVTVRRSPKYANFAMVGALLGAVAAFILTVAIPRDLEYARANGFAEYSQLQVFGFLLLIGLVVGIAIALTIAILLDRRSSRRSRIVEADKVEMHEAPAAGARVETETIDAASAPALEQNPPHLPPTTNEGKA